MLIERHFSARPAPAYEERDVELETGPAKVTVPSPFSQLATEILARKYLRKRGVPDRTEEIAEQGIPASLQARKAASDCSIGSETDARQAFGRIAGAWAYHGLKQGLFATGEEAGK